MPVFRDTSWRELSLYARWPVDWNDPAMLSYAYNGDERVWLVPGAERIRGNVGVAGEGEAISALIHTLH